MAAPDKSGSKYVHTNQERDNNSHDDLYGVNVVELVAENDAGTAISRVKLNKLSGGPIAGTDFDYLDVQYSDGDTETFVFKTGGSGGTTVRTVVVNYTSSSKTDIDNVSWS